MSDETERLGKLILLRRVREEAEREALAGASQVEARAREGEQAAERRRKAVEDELARRRQEDPGERPIAQVLQLRHRALRRVEVALAWSEAQAGAARRERIGAAEAAARIRARLAAARRARELMEERQAAARLEQRRRCEAAEEQARDDEPGGGDAR
jgi:hypothetical protein